MRKLLAPSVCCAALMLAGAALAAESSTVAPLTVQGMSPGMITTESRAFVDKHAIAANPEIGQISRWHWPVCVQVEGVAPAQAAAVKARIEGVAQSVGLPSAWGGASCKANVEIVFSDNPQATMDEVARRREDFLGYYHRAERDRLKTVSRPIQAWYKTATSSDRNNGGLVTATFEDSFRMGEYEPYFPGQYVGHISTDDPDRQGPVGCGDAPHFTSCLTSLFQNVFIVVDSKALQANGIGVGVASDYLALLALSQPKALDGCAGLPSILDLTAKTACAGRERPDGLTAADAAWLTALYASDAQANGDGARTEIATRMADILIKASAPAGAR